MPNTIRVIAPATLEEGFTFDVLLMDDQPYTVTVPPGGVKQGQEFEIPCPPTSEEQQHDISDAEEEDDCKDERATLPVVSSEEEEDASHDALGAPLGQWRNHVCACCDVVTQATFWMAFCCLPIAMAQLLTRLGLDWRGLPNTRDETSLAYNKIVLTLVAVLVFGIFVPIAGLVTVVLYLLIVLLYIGTNVRRYMRQKYQIKSSTWHDVGCMLACGCCSLIQMARHTHDDKEYPGYCCTTTGLELGAPEIV